MEKRMYNLTFPQQNILYMERFNQDTSVNVITGLVNIKKDFNQVLCDKAINEVIRKNMAMRTRILETEGEFCQYFAEYNNEEIEVIDMSSYSKEQIREYIDGMASQSLFALDSKLYDFKILKYSQNEGSIFMRIHHIISDAWSCSKIGTELIKQMEEMGEEIEELPSYMEYIESENVYKESDKYIKDKEFWSEYLQDVNETVSLKEKTSQVSNNAKRYAVKLDEEFNNRVLTFCKENRISPYALFLSAVSTYIYRVKDKNDIVLGTPVLNRANFKEKKILGMFVSTLPLRIKIEENENFLELTKKIGRDTLNVFRHQKYPYMETLEYVRKNSNIKTNLYNIVLSYQNARTDVVNEEKYSTSWAFSNMLEDELQIHIMDMDDTGILNINYDYKTDLFEDIEIEYLHTRIMAIIENAIEDLDVNVENIRIMSKEEEDKILYEFNDTKTDYPKDKTVIELFEEQVEKTPDNIALVFEDKTMTYKELNEKANCLAHYLREEKGIKANDIVALILNRGFDMIISILAVLKSGAAYLPIDPAFPEERIKYMLDDSEVKVKINKTEVNRVLSSNNANIYNVKVNTNDEDLVYILYTSGSTGKPKGVMIKNKGLKNIAYYFLNHDVYKNIKNIVSITTISFDIFVFDSITSLINGLTVTIANEEEQKIPKLLNKLILKNNIEIMQTTPTRLKLLLDNIGEIPYLKNLKKIVLSGEKVSKKLKNDLLSLGNIEIFNGYGPTENTVFSSFTNITNEDTISIGIPISNTEFYILDKKYRLLPLNIEGELYVSGDNIAKGYINNVELTNKAFVEWNRKKVYKSGDICRLGYDNKVYCLGRIDNQIKLNGIRIELEEISNVINNYEKIVENIAILKNINNKQILIDYYVSNTNISDKDLRKYSSKFLPKYMQPNKYVRLENLPITPNGKIDRKKLELLEDKFSIVDNKIECFSKIQLKLKELVCHILKINEIGANENIYEYGMDSLSIIQLSIDISKYFNIELNVKELYNCINILEIEELIKTSSNLIYNLPNKQEKYPLSSAQFGIFTNYSLNPDSLAYNIPFEMKFGKNIDIDRLKQAIMIAIDSTDTFFTKIEIKNGKPYQRIDKNREYNIDIIEISENNYQKKKISTVKPFDLLSDLLFDINIFKTEESVYVIVNVHHIIFDGLSMNIFLDRVKKAYEKEKVLEDTLSLGQFVLHEENIKSSEKYIQAKEYFNNIFSEELPDNNIVLDKKRKKEKSFYGNKVTLKLDADTSKLIYDFSNRNNVTLNSVFLSMFNILLSKYMYSNDIIIGMATSGRNLKEEIDKIGMFVKTIPFRTKLDIDNSILSYIKSIQNTVLEYIDNSIYTYEDLVRDLNISRDSTRNPLFDIMFVYQNTGMPNINFNGENVELSGILNNTSKFDITFEVMPNESRFDINIEYATDLFFEDTIKDFANHYINLLKSMLANEAGKVKNLDILSSEEKDIILNEYNNTATDYPKEKNIIELFKEQVKLTPENVAVVFEDNKLTYEELDRKSEMLAYHLYENGIKKGDMIAVMMDKSLELMVSILAILKVGAVYVPIELDFPKARIEYILNDTKAKKILINSTDNSNIIDYDTIDVNLNLGIYNKKINKEDVDIKINPKDLVYVMYTSGTTGNPKGVMVNNQNVVRLIKNTNYISLKKDDRIIQTGSTAFDATTFEYYVALFNGLPVYLLKKQDMLDMKKFEDYIIKNKITIMFITTQLFNQIVEYKTELLDNFRVILTGGEAHSIKHINAVKQKCPHLTLFNVYGPTENTTFSTYYEIKDTCQNLPIGKPISNSTCYVLDKSGNLCYTNMLGELVVGGDGVSKGYLNNKELTNKKFIEDKYINKKKGKMYKTGDLVYLNRDGDIEFCGRIDTQVKIRGFRIEPDEINQRLIQYRDVKESVVVVENHNGKKVIVAYYTSDINIERSKLVEYLKEFLPQYMIPTYFVNITKIPLNNSGKADKNKLFELGQEIIKDKQNKEKKEIRYEGEYLKVYELFKEVLNIDNINYNDDFFEIGGDSLLALKLVTNAIAKDIPITYPDLFKHPTIKELGDMLNKTLNEKSICEPMYTFDYTNVNNVLKNNIYKEDFEVKDSIGNVLLTGVTGFLGAHILDEFMKSENGNIYCIIRNKNGIDASERLKEILNFFFGSKYDNEIGNRIFVIEGDISGDNKFKIDNKTIEDITTVINSAACVKHFGEYELFKKINVDLVQDLINFCIENKKRFIQVSTLSVSGNLLEAGQLDQTKVKPNTIFNETNLYIEQNLDNVYAYTKYLAEKLVYDAIAIKGLDGKVMRMGNLTGRTGDGKFQPNVSENAFANRLKTMLELNVLPNNMLDFYLEFTPIDYAARAVILLSKTEEKYNTYHLFNHNHAMLYFVDKVLNDKLDIHLKHITKEEMTEIIERYSKQKDGFDKIKGIVLDVNKNKELEYVSNIKIKSDFTIGVLEKLGFKWPEIKEEYIKKYLGYLFDIGFLIKEGEE